MEGLFFQDKDYKKKGFIIIINKAFLQFFQNMIILYKLSNRK